MATRKPLVQNGGVLSELPSGDVMDLGDQQLAQVMLKDHGVVFLDKGNSGTSAQTVDFSAAGHQKITATGSHAVSLSGWPPSGNTAYRQLDYVNAGAFTLTWSTTVNWVKPDRTTTTSLATYLASVSATLQTSGTDRFVFWCSDGVNVFGKLVM